MTNNETIDYLPDLSDLEIASAIRLTFSNYNGSFYYGDDFTKQLMMYDASVQDGVAFYMVGVGQKLQKIIFQLHGQEGATYDFSATNPVLYDETGNAIAEGAPDMPGVNSSRGFSDFIAPYDGDYYLSIAGDAEWLSGGMVAIYEDIDTIGKTISPLDSINPVDRIYNWGESVYPDLFPENQESVGFSVYYARIYSNGDALGEQNGNIYYYDGGTDGSGEVVLVGGISDFLPQAIAAGF
ncbi:hypothetical protein [Nitrosomonas sp.]|uniref:hypothetical protein n=1 Tax=Nitrosomonas sp. TaxID=42353 RepID=UPI002730C971|nr:hypothetical protein [Nitrosomonas sp.]MDP2225597.1 hypothetical protein [Nitrosomonas sp.]